MLKEDTPESLKNHAIAGGKWTAGSAIFGVAIQIIQLAALGRLLGPAEFGMMAIMMVVIGLANSIADFGFANYLMQIDGLGKALFKRLLLLGLALSLLLWGLIALISPLVANYFNMPLLLFTLPWFGLVTVFTTIAQLYTAVLQRSFKFQPIAIIDITSAGVGLTVSVFLAIKGYGVWALVVGQLSMTFLKAAISLIAALPLTNQLSNEISYKTNHAFRFGAFQIGERALNFASANVDKLIIGKLLGDQALGIYSVAFQLILRPILVINPIFNRVAMPIFAKVKHDNLRLTRGYIEMLRTICFVTFPIYLVLCISSPVIINLLLGEKWESASTLTSILAFLGFLFAIGNPVGVLVVAKGRVDFSFYFNAAVVFINLVACYIGSFFGIYWVASLVVLASWFILFPMEFYLRFKLVGMGISEYLIGLKPHFIATGIPLLFFVLAYSLGLKPQNNWWSAIAGFLSLCTYLAYFYAMDRNIIINTVGLISPKFLNKKTE
jgi:O-antigen/teichoic acid export membrane protein